MKVLGDSMMEFPVPIKLDGAVNGVGSSTFTLAFSARCSAEMSSKGLSLKYQVTTGCGSPTILTSNAIERPARTFLSARFSRSMCGGTEDFREEKN